MAEPILRMNLEERMSVIMKCNTVGYYQGKHFNILQKFVNLNNHNFF